jgi:hypothetical protein
MNPRLPITFTLMLLSQSVLLAVSPLVTDDADTVEAGKLQLNCDFQIVRTSSTSLYLVPINPVLGLTPRLELGAIFGYQRRDGSGSDPITNDADDLTDLTIAPKLRLWQGLEDKLKFGARPGPETADRIRPAWARHRKFGHRRCGNRDLHHREDEPGF